MFATQYRSAPHPQSWNGHGWAIHRSQWRNFDDGGTQIYHGMLLSLQRRAARGLTFSGNYTWSHCIGSLRKPSTRCGPAADVTYTNPNDRNFDRGNCSADRRQLFNLTALAETPQFSNNSLRMLATGWRLSGIYRVVVGRTSQRPGRHG